MNAARVSKTPWCWCIPWRRLAAVTIPWAMVGWLSFALAGRTPLTVSTGAGSTDPTPLAGWTVVIDPGHGGHDRGACHFADGIVEKEINLDVAIRLQALLQEQGARVVLTRVEDEFVPLETRADMANRVGADVFVSVHVNRYPSPDCFGAQAFYFPGSEESRRLALLVQQELRTLDPANDRQALPGRYRVLRLTRMPGTLVEIGFASNPGDRARMREPAYREAAAAAIVRGLVRFATGEQSH